MSLSRPRSPTGETKPLNMRWKSSSRLRHSKRSPLAQPVANRSIWPCSATIAETAVAPSVTSIPKVVAAYFASALWRQFEYVRCAARAWTKFIAEMV